MKNISCLKLTLLATMCLSPALALAEPCDERCQWISQSVKAMQSELPVVSQYSSLVKVAMSADRSTLMLHHKYLANFPKRSKSDMVRTADQRRSMVERECIETPESVVSDLINKYNGKVEASYYNSDGTFLWSFHLSKKCVVKVLKVGTLE